MPLKMFRQRGHSVDFWEKFWEKRLEREPLREYYQSYRYVPLLQKIALKYLPKDGRILDAGCGSGIWTYWLGEKGYHVDGIDVSQNVIRSIQAALPELRVRVCSVFDLDYPDNSFAGYFSMGVAGYFENGPEKILKEAARVLKQGGIVIMRIPYFNPVRRVKHFLNIYKDSDGDHYQYAFTRREIETTMDAVGLTMMRSYTYDGIRGFLSEMFGMETLHNRVMSGKEKSASRKDKAFRRVFRQLFGAIFGIPPLHNAFSDSIVIIAKKV